jgi:hypothetical protein
MPRKKQLTAKPAPKQEIKQSADFKSIYANWVQGSFSPHDVWVIFGESFPNGPQSAIVEQKARVIVSPLEAKLLAMILGKIVGAYEEQFGKLVVPHVIGDLLVDQIPEIKKLMAPKTEG